MEAALLDAKLNATAIDYVNAHATSTILGDLAESNAVKAVFGNISCKLFRPNLIPGKHVNNIGISSIKVGFEKLFVLSNDMKGRCWALIRSSWEL